VDVDDLLRQALDKGDEGDWEGMAEELAQALELVPEDPRILCWLGVAEQELGLAGSAYDRFRDALRQDPADPFVLATLGGGLAHFDDPEAEAALRAAAMLAPDLPLARWMYGAYLSREGLFTEALRELEAGRALAPDDPVIAFELGVALALKGEMNAAAEALTAAVDLDPGDGWSLSVLGLVEMELGRSEEAVRDLTESARCRPEDVEVQFLAALAAHAGEWEDLASEMLERGRQLAEAGDLPLLEAVERSLLDGPEASRRLMVQEVLPGVLRDRLMTRP